jgi:hypothetical protein
VGRADSSPHGPGLASLGRLDQDAARATAFGLGRNVGGLAADSLFNHTPGNLFTDLDGELLDIDELGPSWNTPLAVNATIQLFCEATQQVFLDDRWILYGCHPWLRSILATRWQTAFKTAL